MRTREGRGYLLHTGEDVPYAGWGGVHTLDAAYSLASAPWEGLAVLVGLAGLLPGGYALLWDGPVEWLAAMPPETRRGYWKMLTRAHGLTLHLREEHFTRLLRGPAQARLHAPKPPVGDLGHAWRQGWLGWIPEEPGSPVWTLPDLGVALDTDAPGWLWGELLLPLGALEHLEPADLARVLEEAQARCERAISLRMEAGAWPLAFPFQRRRTGWRVAFLGGREWQLSGASWDRAADKVRDLVAHLEQELRCPIHPGVSTDARAAAALGQQAMNEGLPWRAALPLPPAHPSFTPGLGADPRDAVTLEARASFPQALAGLLSPPEVRLRVPAVPLEGSVKAFLGGFQAPPAIRWFPPDVEPPGPFTPEWPWAKLADYPHLAAITQALHPSLFDDLD
jgi:hypothetical protein